MYNLGGKGFPTACRVAHKHEIVKLESLEKRSEERNTKCFGVLEVMTPIKWGSQNVSTSVASLGYGCMMGRAHLLESIPSILMYMLFEGSRVALYLRTSRSARSCLCSRLCSVRMIRSRSRSWDVTVPSTNLLFNSTHVEHLEKRFWAGICTCDIWDFQIR